MTTCLSPAHPTPPLNLPWEGKHLVLESKELPEFSSIRWGE